MNVLRMKLWQRLKEKLAGKLLERSVRRGKTVWGRQPTSPGSVGVASQGRGVISAKVYRAATDRWEDLGVIGGWR